MMHLHLSWTLLVYLVIFSSRDSSCFASEFTFELPDNEKQCFYEVREKDEECLLEYQVVSGGKYDVDIQVRDPGNRVIHQDTKKQYDTFTWKTSASGAFTFCFSNEFSSFSHKVIFFGISCGDDPMLGGEDDDRPGAMTQMEANTLAIFESLKAVISYQTHFRLNEFTGRRVANGLHNRVLWWSVGEIIVLLSVGVGQVLLVRSFFSDRKNVGSSGPRGKVRIGV